MAYQNVGEFDLAFYDLQNAYKFNPNDKGIKTEYMRMKTQKQKMDTSQQKTEFQKIIDEILA